MNINEQKIDTLDIEFGIKFTSKLMTNWVLRRKIPMCGREAVQFSLSKYYLKKNGHSDV